MAREQVDAVPPTVRERPTRKRGGGCGLVVLAGLVAAAIGAAALWVFVLRAPARAIRHVPSNATLVARVDLGEIALFGPVRKHLVPLFDAPEAPASGASATPSASAGADRVDRIRQETGVDLRRDVREVVIASVDATSWVALFGGRIERGRFVAGMDRVLRDDGAGGWQLEGDRLVGPRGVVIAQADDGTLVLGTDRSLVGAALPETDDAAHLGLPDGGAVAIVITKPAWSGASTALFALPHGGVLGKVDGASGRFALGDAPALTLRLEAAGGDAVALQADLASMLDEVRAVFTILPDLVGEKAALRGARLRVDGGAVVVEAPWPLEALDRACDRFAGVVRGALARPSIR